MNVFDFRYNKIIDLDGFISDVVNESSRRLGISISENWIQDLNLKEFVSDRNLITEYYQNKQLLTNDLNYEDDVFVYLTLLIRRYMDSKHISAVHDYILDDRSEAWDRLNKITTDREKALLYKINANYIFLLMSAGFMNYSDEKMERSKFYYLYTHSLLEKIHGRQDVMSLIFLKLSNNYHRYYEVLSDAFQETFYNLNIEERPSLLDKPKEERIDELLELLMVADDKQREEIIKELKELNRRP